MTGISSVPSDQKKWIDSVMHAYIPKQKRLRTLFSEEPVDPSQVTNIYGRLTQSYTEAKGYYTMDDPQQLADGATAEADTQGSEDVTSTQKTYSKGFVAYRKLLESGLEFQKSFLARFTVEALNTVENYTNTTLNTNMASNAGQSYTATGGTWATSGDPVADVVDAKNSFRKRSGGFEADFISLHPDNKADVEKDFRFQNTLYSKSGDLLDGGTITPKPLALNWVEDTAVTKGTFFLGKKGMFGRLVVSEPYKMYEKAAGTGDKRFDAVFSFIDQYPLPQYLMYGTGI